MTDAEIISKCFDRVIAFKLNIPKELQSEFSNIEPFNPLKNDADAMALVKKLGLSVTRTYDIHGRLLKNPPQDGWSVEDFMRAGTLSRQWDTDLNRAICLCAAQLPTPSAAVSAGETIKGR